MNTSAKTNINDITKKNPHNSQICILTNQTSKKNQNNQNLYKPKPAKKNSCL